MHAVGEVVVKAFRRNRNYTFTHQNFSHGFVQHHLRTGGKKANRVAAVASGLCRAVRIVPQVFIVCNQRDRAKYIG